MGTLTRISGSFVIPKSFHGKDQNITGSTEFSASNFSITASEGVHISASIDVTGSMTVGGASQFNNTITIGADDTGHDVIFYGDTASSNMTWDTSEDDLVLNDARLYINQDDDKFSQ